MFIRAGNLLYGFVKLQFVVTLQKRTRNAFAAKRSAVFIWVNLFFQDSKTRSGNDFRRHYTA